MRGHILTVTETPDHDPEWPDYRGAIRCLDTDACGGYEECMEGYRRRATKGDPPVLVHEVDGVSAEGGPYDDCPGCAEDTEEHHPWCDEDEYEFHGVLHTWRYGWGWTVPFVGCVVAEQDSLADFAHDIGREYGPGDYWVEDGWGDSLERLEVVACVWPRVVIV